MFPDDPGRAGRPAHTTHTIRSVSDDFTIRVSADVDARDDELAALDQAFGRIGFEIRSQAAVEMKSLGDLPWAIYIEIGAPLATFFSTIAQRAGDDAYDAVKRWAKEVLAARANAERDRGSAVVNDPDGTNLVLTPGLSPEALDALAKLDWSSVSGEYLLWDERAGEWLDAMTPRENDPG